MNLFKRKKNKGRINILELGLLFVSIVSITNVLTLALGIFNPSLCLVLSLVIEAIMLFVFRVKIKIQDNRFGLLFVLVLLLGFALRISPNLYITGGQDPGTYVSLSKQYEINKSLYIKDELRSSLSDETKELYDKSGAATMLGVDALDLEKSIFYMPFYPVFPSWMSTFGSLFGSDNRIYVLTLFGILSIVGIYLLGYEISGRNKKVGILASFIIAINPLHVYFSRTPLTEIVSLTFFLFSLYFLMRFYSNYKNGKIEKIFLILSLLTSTTLFYTRMSALFFAPVIILIPILSKLFSSDRKLSRSLIGYSISWLVSLGLSYLFYYFYLPDLFKSIFEGRLFSLVNQGAVYLAISIFLILLTFALNSAKVRIVMKRILSFIHKYLFAFIIFLFTALLLYQLSFYIKEVFIENQNTLFSFDSLSYLKQLNVLATFLYISPLGFILIPFVIYHFRKRISVEITLLLTLICIFLIYNWGISKFSPYHYYFVRYQVSELIPLLTILISIFLVNVSKKSFGKFVLYFSVIFFTLYFGFFSVIQLKDYEGANQEPFQELQSLIGERNLLLVARNNFGSAQQIVFPMKYFYGINTFTIYSTSYIDKQPIKDLKDEYDRIYILTTLPNWSVKTIKFVKEIDFKHNYFVHCLRDEDSFFEMEGHSPDIPFCEYMVIPNRYYYGTYKMYLYSWE